MNLRSCIAAAGLCLLPLCSQAGIVYEWRPLNNETPRGISLALEFDEDTVRGGAFSLVFIQEAGGGGPADAGLLSLRYSFPGVLEPMTYSARDGFGSGLGTLRMDVRFEQGGLLSGRIFTDDSHHTMLMASTGTVFTVLAADSDEGMPAAGCGSAVGIECGGARGRIRSAEVPEPGSLALLGLGLFAAAALRRKAE